MGATEDDFRCPLVEFRPNINMELEHSPTEVNCQLSDVDLVKKLIAHLRENHFSNIGMIRISFLLEETISEKIEVKVMDNC